MAKLKTIKFKQGGDVIVIDVPAGGSGGAGGTVDWQDVENKPELYDKTEINAMLGNKVDKETTQEQEVRSRVNFRGGIETDHITTPSSLIITPSSLIIDSHAFFGTNADKDVYAGKYYEGLTSSDDNRLATRKYVIDRFAELVGSSPEVLDTIYELAEALQNNPDIINELLIELSNLQDTKESLTNKAINFSVVNDTKYPTTKAVKDLVDATVGNIDTILDSILGV